jgi:hypothetical protein
MRYTPRQRTALERKVRQLQIALYLKRDEEFDHQITKLFCWLTTRPQSPTRARK